MSLATVTPVRTKRQVRFPLGAKPITDEGLERLAELKGRCGRAQGVTNDMMKSIGSTIEEVTGVRVVLVWDFFDMWGFGGNSEWAVVAKNGQLREIPEGWFDFLWDGSDADIRELFSRPAGAVFPRWQRLIESEAYNYVRKESPTEELG